MYNNPSMVWVLLFAILIAWILYRWRPVGLFVLRAGTVLWLGLMILNPAFPRWTRSPQRPVLVIDASRSMKWNGKWDQTQKILKTARSLGLPIRFLVDSSLAQDVEGPIGAFTDLTIPLKKISGPLVLWSDGHHNTGSDLMLWADQRKNPVFVLIPPAMQRSAGTQIKEWTWPSTLGASEQAKVFVRWQGSAAKIRLYVDGELVQEAGVTGQTQWTTTLPPLRPGGHALSLQLLDEEGTVVDQRSGVLRVLPPKFRVLVISSHPSPVVSMLRRVFSSTAEVKVAVQIQDNVWRTLQEDTVRTGLPPIQSDLMIAVDPDPGILKKIPSLPVIWIVGRQSAGTQFRGVVVGRRPWGNLRPYPLGGTELPAFQEVWPLTWTDSIRLYWQAQGATGQPRTPVPLMASVPEKALVVVSSSEIWKARLVVPEAFDSLWTEVVDDLMQKRAIFSVFALKPRVLESEPLQIQAEYRDYRGRRIPGAWVNVQTPQQVLPLLEVAEGEFLSPEFYLPQGTYTLKVTYGKDQQTLGTDSVQVQVARGDVEQWGRDVDSLTLKELARRTGGQVLRTLKDIQGLRIAPVEGPPVRPFRRPWALFPLVVLLSIEWLWRQRRGWL